MHYPEMWGLVSFTAKGYKSKIDPYWGEEEKWILRQLYYQQKNFFKKYTHFASKLDELGLTKLPVQFEFSATASTYVISVWRKGYRIKWFINESGRTWKETDE